MNAHTVTRLKDLFSFRAEVAFAVLNRAPALPRSTPR